MSHSDWRDVDHSWYSKMKASGPGGSHNGQPMIVVADDGSWVCSWKTGTREASPDCHIVCNRSVDKGLTWSPEQDVEPEDHAHPSSDSCLHKSPVTGRIFCIYRYNVNSHVGPGTTAHAGGFFFRYSDDHGQTWSGKRYPIPTRRTAIDHPTGELSAWTCGQGPVVIGDGFWFSGTKYEIANKGGGMETWFWVSPNILSEKNPESIKWENKPDGKRGITTAHGHKYWEEAALVTLSDDNHLYCVMRTRNAGFLGQSYSKDGGNTWSEPTPAEYWDGSGEVNNPKAGPALLKLSDGTYFLTFYNDRADKTTHWSKLFDRSPLWSAVGWQDGDVLKFSQPEILLYNDQDTSSSAEGNRFDIHAPFVFETDGRIFVAYANKLTDLQVTEIPCTLIEGLKNQRIARRIKTDHLAVWIDANDDPIGRTVPVHAPAKVDAVLGVEGETAGKAPTHDKVSAACFSFQRQDGGDMMTLHGIDVGALFGGLDEGASLAVELWAQFRDVKAGQTLLNNRNAKGHGIWLGLEMDGRVSIELTDVESRTQKAASGRKSVSANRWCHIVANVDGASDVITLLIDGKISGDNPRKNFHEMGRALGDINGSSTVFIGHQSAGLQSPKIPFRGRISQLRIYDRYLTTNEAIANYRAGT